MHIRISTKLGFGVKLFGLAWGLNLIWEILQQPLYVIGKFPAFPWVLLRTSTWDAFYVLIVYLFLAFLHQDFYWLRRKNIWDLGLIILIGFITSTVVERQSLALGKWSYTTLMPIVPVLGVGFVPFIQLPIMAFLVYFIMRRYFKKSVE